MVRHILESYSKGATLSLENAGAMLGVLCISPRTDYLQIAAAIMALRSSKVAQMIDVQSARNGTPALCACLDLPESRVKIDLVRLFLEQGADVNIRTSETKDTPLHFATKHQQTSNVRELLARQAKADSLNAKGESPISIARSLRNFDLLQLLVG
jgi:ankyrin repeat protein